TRSANLISMVPPPPRLNSATPHRSRLPDSLSGCRARAIASLGLEKATFASASRICSRSSSVWITVPSLPAGNGAVVAWERTTHGGKNDTGGGILRHGSRRQQRKRAEKVPEKAALAGKRAKGRKKM